MTITLSALQKQRYDTAANWTAENPTLLAGEIGVESDTGKIKIGTGATAWTSLSYSGLIPGSGVYPYSQLLMPSGTAGAPSISFDGDGDSGIYRSGANAVAISTNGTGRLFVNSSGNIGVKTTTTTYDAAKVGSSHTFLSIQSGASSYSNVNIAGNTSSADRVGLLAFVNDANSASYKYNSWIEAKSTGTTAGQLGGALLFSTSGEGSTAGPGERLRITSAGLVGIGNSIPGSFYFNNLVVGRGSGDNGVTVYSGTTSTGVLAFADGTSGSGRYDGYINYDHSNQSMGFFTNTGNRRMTIDSSGRLGIGTASPENALHIVSTAGEIVYAESDRSTNGQYVGGLINVARNSSGNSAAYAGIYGSIISNTAATESGALTFWTRSSGSLSERARIDSSGRLLVGTSSAPSAGGWNQYAKIVSQGNAGDPNSTGIISLNRNEAATSITSGEAIGVISFGSSAGNEFGLIECIADANAGSSDYPGRLVFSVSSDGSASPTERARITSNGVFKQSTSGSYNDATGIYNEFNVNNSNSYVIITRCTSSSPASEYIQDFRFSAAAPNNTSARFWSCTDNSAERGYLASNGGLYNYSANNSNLSDRNAKKDISPAAGTWDCLKEWEIVNFRYKDQPDDAGLNLGVIAQQVAESCPEVITVFQEAKEATEDQPAQEERLGVKEQQMYWMAIKALQEAQVRIEQLEAKVAALESA